MQCKRTHKTLVPNALKKTQTPLNPSSWLEGTWAETLYFWGAPWGWVKQGPQSPLSVPCCLSGHLPRVCHKKNLRRCTERTEKSRQGCRNVKGCKKFPSSFPSIKRDAQWNAPCSNWHFWTTHSQNKTTIFDIFLSLECKEICTIQMPCERWESNIKKCTTGKTETFVTDVGGCQRDL